MVESPRREYYAIESHFAGNTGDGDANAGQRQAFKARRDSGARPNEEEKFVLLTAMQRLLGCRAGKARRHHDVRGYAGCQANALEIERQAVTDIDCRCRSQFFAQELSEREPGLGIQVALAGFAF